MRPLACLLLLASTGAESWKGWLARGATDGFQNFVHATAEIDDARTSAHSLRIDGKVLSVKELEFALQGARLAFLAYADSQWEVEAGLRDARMELVCFAPQRAQARVGVPQWYLARSGDALYLVFRGTQSAFDMLHDLMAMPEAGTEDDRFHSGFLHAVQDVAGPVRDAVAAELRRGRGGGSSGSSGDTGGSGGSGEGGGGAYERLYLVGHSLGGALALTLLGADLLPGSEELEGRALPPVSVLTYGSPAAFHRRCKSRAVRKADVQAILVPTLIVVGHYCTYTRTRHTPCAHAPACALPRTLQLQTPCTYAAGHCVQRPTILTLLTRPSCTALTWCRGSSAHPCRCCTRRPVDRWIGG